MCKDKYCKEFFAETDRIHDYYITQINELKSKLEELESKYMKLVRIYVDKLLKDANYNKEEGEEDE